MLPIFIIIVNTNSNSGFTCIIQLMCRQMPLKCSDISAIRSVGV